MTTDLEVRTDAAFSMSALLYQELRRLDAEDLDRRVDIRFPDVFSASMAFGLRNERIAFYPLLRMLVEMPAGSGTDEVERQILKRCDRQAFRPYLPNSSSWMQIGDRTPMGRVEAISTTEAGRKPENGIAHNAIPKDREHARAWIKIDGTWHRSADLPASTTDPALDTKRNVRRLHQASGHVIRHMIKKLPQDPHERSIDQIMELHDVRASILRLLAHPIRSDVRHEERLRYFQAALAEARWISKIIHDPSSGWSENEKQSEKGAQFLERFDGRDDMGRTVRKVLRKLVAEAKAEIRDPAIEPRMGR